MTIRHAIFAQSRSGHIGRKGNHPLLWKLKGDLPRFKDLTHGGAIIMGRNTCESLPFLLPDRFHIVVSKSLPPSLDLDTNMGVVNSLDEAWSMATLFGYEDQFVIGGGDLINQALPFCHVVHRTVVNETCNDLSEMSLVDLPGEKPYWGGFQLTECSMDSTITHWYETYHQSEPKEPTKG